MSMDPRLARSKPEQQAQPVPVPPPPPPVEAHPDSTKMGLDGTNDTQRPAEAVVPDGEFKLKFCTVCASNQNRSMEAHLRLASAQLPTISFGTGSLVRLPGPSMHEPNVYRFNSTTYSAIHDELRDQNRQLYTANGLLNMLSRNLNIKGYPERFQDWVPGVPRLDHAADKGAQGTEAGVVDVIITCEERCFDAVLDDLHNKGGRLNRPVHVFNVDIKDNHEEALVGGRGILDLALSLNQAAAEERKTHGEAGWETGSGAARAGFDERVPEILAAWQERWPNLPALWSLAWS
ncbi:Ssu72-like protein [Delitschia confertaspora ATCC 74209]|uniref:RNA polymerase II subunit A C-terminal domain phosphatase SSU72 n=1 Tax=Delitschia confertaspora ATCC 74209 TaxID=1513339 RepID=A0A9P4JUQ7_9PLEO|nr:Ssu72-like protein [Delitschia confertaspora ATCC 74209]